MYRLSFLACGLMAISFLGLPFTGVVRANGEHQEVFSGPVGQYQVQATASTGGGRIHLTVYVASAESGVPDPDVELWVTAESATDPDQVVGPERVRRSFWLPDRYEVTLPAEVAGEWLLTLQIGAGTGGGAVDFAVDVQPQPSAAASPGQPPTPPGPTGLPLAMGAMAVLLLVIAGIFVGRRRRHPSP